MATVPDMQLRRQLIEPSKNSYVYKLGYRYAILWYKRSSEIEKHIAETFGAPAKSFHYTTWRGTISLKPTFKKETAPRWYYGAQRWGDGANTRNGHWAVFKTEKERTLALLTF